MAGRYGEPCPYCGSRHTYWNKDELVCRNCGRRTYYTETEIRMRRSPIF